MRTPASGTEARVAEGEVLDAAVAVAVAGDVEVSCRLSSTASVKTFSMISFVMRLFCGRLLCSLVPGSTVRRK